MPRERSLLFIIISNGPKTDAFFFFSSTTFYEFWLAQLFLSIVSSLAPSVSSSSLPSFSGNKTDAWELHIILFPSLMRILLIILGHYVNLLLPTCKTGFYTSISNILFG
jgi:hypothetical protein